MNVIRCGHYSKGTYMTITKDAAFNQVTMVFYDNHVTMYIYVPLGIHIMSLCTYITTQWWSYWCIMYPYSMVHLHCVCFNRVFGFINKVYFENFTLDIRATKHSYKLCMKILSILKNLTPQKSPCGSGYNGHLQYHTLPNFVILKFSNLRYINMHMDTLKDYQ